MPVSEDQLSTWSHQGAIATSSTTYNSIKSSLATLSNGSHDYRYEIFLQGSYSNDTNVYKESDVDVVIMLTSLFTYNIDNLPEQQKSTFQQSYSNSIQNRNDFKKIVFDTLCTYYGRQNVVVGNKSIKITGSSNRRNADVIVCNEFRDYKFFISRDNSSYDEGIVFNSATENSIKNFPKLHSMFCTQKHQRTGAKFKPIVRIFKNIKNNLISNNKIRDNVAPSYYLEGLLYNVPDTAFAGSYNQIIHNAVGYFRKADESSFTMPNEKDLLFGASSIQWNISDCREYLDALIALVG